MTLWQARKTKQQKKQYKKKKKKNIAIIKMSKHVQQSLQGDFSGSSL